MRRTNIKLTSVTVKTSHSCPRYTVHCNEKHIVTCSLLSAQNKRREWTKRQISVPLPKKKTKLKKCQKLLWHNLWMQTRERTLDECLRVANESRTGVIRRGTYNLKYAKGFAHSQHTISTAQQQLQEQHKHQGQQQRDSVQSTNDLFCSFFVLFFFLVFYSLVWSAKFCKLLALNALLSDSERSRSGSRSSSRCRSCSRSRSRSHTHCPSLMLWLWLCVWPCAVFQYTVNCGHDKETSLEALFAEKHNVMWLSFSTMFG